MQDNDIIEQKKRQRKIFTATFDSYDFFGPEKKICCINLKDERGNLLKERFCFTDSDLVKSLIGSLTTGVSEVEFLAELIVDKECEEGFRLVDISIIPDVIGSRHS